MGKYDKLKKINTSQKTAESLKYEKADRAFDEMIKDADRTAEIYRNAESYLDDIDKQFEISTGLEKRDVVFLFLATALQIGRWVVIGLIDEKLTGKINDSRVEHDAKSVKDKEKEQQMAYMEKHKNDAHVKSKEHRDWANIIFESVPYDITTGCGKYGVNMGGAYHRVHTLGHDPVLGWIFGTMNILSDTITLDKSYGFKTFDVQMRQGPKMWAKETTVFDGFRDAYESVREDFNRLPAAVFKQAMHLKSDELTKLGLPIPLLETFAPDMAGKLYKENYDSLMMMKDIAKVGVQAVVAVIINMLVTLIHGLFYDSEKYLSRDLYEVKTRKILMWSNVIASASNVLAVTAMEATAGITKDANLAKKGLHYIDIGGYIVTMHRLVSDTKFINNVKKEFLEKEWNRLVIGDEYKFISEEHIYE